MLSFSVCDSDDISETHVVYAEVVEIGGEGRLTKLIGMCSLDFKHVCASHYIFLDLHSHTYICIHLILLCHLILDNPDDDDLFIIFQCRLICFSSSNVGRFVSHLPM